jgi:hypothetical protein
VRDTPPFPERLAVDRFGWIADAATQVPLVRLAVSADLPPSAGEEWTSEFVRRWNPHEDIVQEAKWALTMLYVLRDVVPNQATLPSYDNGVERLGSAIEAAGGMP